MSTGSGSGPSRMERFLLGTARVLVGHPKTVLAVWAVLVALTMPFASRLDEVLGSQGASKVVAGTSSAQAATLATESFPQHSEREVAVVLTGWDAQSLPMRQLLAVLDAAISPLAARGEVLQTGSAFTLHRDAIAAFVDGQLAAAGPAGTGPVTPAKRSALEAHLDAQQLPPPVRELVLASQGQGEAAREAKAGDFTVAADWQNFPVPVSTRDVVSADGRTTLVSVSYAPGGDDPDPAELRGIVGSVVSGLHLDSQVEAHVTGEIPLLQDTYALAEADNARMEQIAYVVIAIVLLLFFRAVLPAIITVAVIGLAMNVSQAWLFLLGHNVSLTQFTATIMTFVMLGAGIDYSMLLSSRYRQERLAGRDVRDAVIHATVRAGDSVLLAGAAVVLSFGATLLSPVDWIPPLGYGGLVGIPIVLLAALTITPALLVLLGDRFFWLGLRPMADLEAGGALSSSLRRVVGVARSCPLLVVLVFLLATVPAAMVIGRHSLSADPLALSPDTDARRGALVVTKEWGESALFPTVVVGALPHDAMQGGTLTPAGEQRLANLVTALAADSGVARVSAVTHPAGSDQPAVPTAALPDQVRRAYLSDSGTARIVVAVRGDPFSENARATVERLAATVHRADLPGLVVGGATRVDAQYDEALAASFWTMIATVSIGIFILLLLALKSVLIPLRLVATIMMSNVLAIAIVVAVYRIWRDDAVINDLPVFLVILMMGLGMDYEIFLITRVRDLVRQGLPDGEATMAAVVDTGRVITAAGLVMAGSLGTMMLSSTLMLQQYGLGLGAAVLLDATLVRMFFVPASLLLLRRYNWWMPRIPFPRRATA